MSLAPLSLSLVYLLAVSSPWNYSAAFPHRTWHFLSLLSPSSTEDEWYSARTVSHPIRPRTAFFFLHVTISYVAFSPGWIPLLLNFPSSRWDVLLPEAKLQHCPYTQPNLAVAEHPAQPVTLILPPQHRVTLPLENRSPNIASIISSHQKHDCNTGRVDTYSNIFCRHMSTI